MTITIHVLHAAGFPLCRFLGTPRGQWPLGHISIEHGQYEATAAACRDPADELHAIARYEMCPGCEREIANPTPLDPIVPTEGRTCEHCDAPLVSSWPAVYCSNECAFADADPLSSAHPMAAPRLRLREVTFDQFREAVGTLASEADEILASACTCGDLECPVHPDCECGCPAHAHWRDTALRFIGRGAAEATGRLECAAGRIGCGCKRYRPRGLAELDHVRHDPEQRNEDAAPKEPATDLDNLGVRGERVDQQTDDRSEQRNDGDDHGGKRDRDPGDRT